MSPDRPWTMRVRDIIDAVDEIQRFVSGFDAKSFGADPKTVKAVLADFQIMGEAASHVPERLRDAHPEIPWRLMRQMRNFIVHVYFAADPRVVWQTIQEDLPPLRIQLVALLDAEVDSSDPPSS